jgi:methylthioribose-1-phosphate isomerase
MSTRGIGNTRTIEWIGGLEGCVRLIDQTLLPEQLAVIDCHDVDTVWHAIKRLCVRGAPAIGIAAAMGLVLAVRKSTAAQRGDFLEELGKAADYLASARPTAVNLFWALNRMKEAPLKHPESGVEQLKQLLLDEANRIREEDAAMCRSIGLVGEPLIPNGGGVLTHCNAGGLATAEYGTALAPMYVAHSKGKSFRAYADETRPLLQGSRLTAWELQRAGIDVTVICDNMAADVMRAGKVNLVITGADRIAANGDAANKIGTYGVAVLAQAHGIPFYVAAPSSTFDLATPTGADIPIEERSDEEVRRGFGRQTVPDGVKCHCPAFDVTPARLITGLITEKGLISPVSAEAIVAMLGVKS